MRGTRLITLIQPGEERVDPTRLTPPRAAGKRWPVWATRKDSPAPAEGYAGSDVLGGSWNRVYTITELATGRNRVTEEWTMIAEDGVELDIETVAERNSGARVRFLQLSCVRRRVKGGVM